MENWFKKNVVVIKRSDCMSRHQMLCPTILYSLNYLAPFSITTLLLDLAKSPLINGYTGDLVKLPKLIPPPCNSNKDTKYYSG